jgi:hypothetical protein
MSRRRNQYYYSPIQVNHFPLLVYTSPTGHIAIWHAADSLDSNNVADTTYACYCCRLHGELTTAARPPRDFVKPSVDEGNKVSSPNAGRSLAP